MSPFGVSNSLTVCGVAFLAFPLSARLISVSAMSLSMNGLLVAIVRKLRTADDSLVVRF